MKRLILILAMLWALGAVAQTKAPASSASKAALPDIFAGWQKQGAQVSTVPAVADPTNAAVLNEYGFADFESATYTRDDRKLTAKAIRFKDASGAYGAFTFYKTPVMQTEKIGDQASSANTRVLFYRGNVLVTVDLDKVTPMSAGELRELAANLPQISGQAKNLPTLPLFLPKKDYVRNSVKYVLGPAGLASVGSPLSATEIDFATSPEIAVAQYATNDGVATMELISYPTPAIAGEKLKRLQATHPAIPSPDVAPFLLKRSGPLLAVVTGPVTHQSAKSLIATVNYDADVTWNEDTGMGKSGNVGSLLVSLVVLTLVILGLALVSGLAFGGFRILVKRLLPGRVFDRAEDIEFIELKLR